MKQKEPPQKYRLGTISNTKLYLAVQIQKSGLVLVLLAFLVHYSTYAHNIPWHVPKLVRVDAKYVNDPGPQNKVKGQTSAK